MSWCAAAKGLSMMNPYRVDAATPVLGVPDVGRTLSWYRDVLGFKVDPFPADPPYAFAILEHTGTQIMLRRLQHGESIRPPSIGLDIYLRIGSHTLMTLWDSLKDRVEVVEPPTRRFYGDTEFTIRDPDGRQLCLSEYLPEELAPPFQPEAE
jgi:catechol 2,3-dioxygenase-like lactoylglutathione lyase family enzyme